MNATATAIIVLVCWNTVITLLLIEHIMETREYLHKLFRFILEVIDIIREMKNEHV